jgi:hypothetical protein
MYFPLESMLIKYKPGLRISQVMYCSRRCELEGGEGGSFSIPVMVGTEGFPTLL